MFKRPAAAVLLKGIVKKFAPHDRFAQDIECRSGLAVGVGKKVDDVVAVGHDRLQLVFGHLHVVHNLMGGTKPGLVVIVHLALGHKLYKTVEAFVEPTPLALIAVDDHWEVVVTHLVNDGGNGIDFSRFGVGSIRLRTSRIETDHWVFHTIGGFYGDGRWVGKRDRVL